MYKKPARTTPARLVSAHKEVAATRLRMYGHNYDYIAERVGFATPAAAYTAVRRTLDRLPSEPVDELRKIELERLDMLQQVAWLRLRRLTSGKGLLRVGGKRSADPIDPIPVILKIMERRAKLQGLDAPQTYRLLEEEVDKLAAATGKPKADIIAMAQEIAFEAGAGAL